MSQPERNAPCTCGSGKKFKKCCMNSHSTRQASVAQPANAVQELLRMPEQHIIIGNFAQAEFMLQQVLAAKPDYPQAYYLCGMAQAGQGKCDEAAASYEAAIKYKKDFYQAMGNLAAILSDGGKFAESEMWCRRALSVAPKEIVLLKNLGGALQALGQLDEAAASYRRALEIKPDYIEVLNDLGVALNSLGQLDGAAASYRRALEINPSYAAAHSNLGVVLHELGQTDSAVLCHHRALELQPDVLQHAIHAHLLLPIILESLDAVAVWRERYQTGIAALMNAPGTLEEPGITINTFSFFLAYHNRNNRTIMEALCRFFRGRLTGLTATSPHMTNWRPSMARGQRIRVGFLSEFLMDHTIGKHYQGFIQHLDRSRFEVVVIHAPKTRHDGFSKLLDALADKAITLPARLKDQQQAVMAEKLDVLLYPDIGMSMSTYFLAYARLAPIQATSWGHPDTSGLDTMDYYVSSALNEPEDADGYYTERLIHLNRLPCFYYRTAIAPARKLTRADLGLPETGALYGCPQTLFKFHPDFDAVLAAIAEGDPTGHIVLPEGKHPAWTTLLKARWAKSFPILLERVLFLPRMSMDHFMALMEHMDVLLDTPHFGSGNTLYDAMVYGIPVVTWPGRFARGRNVAAAYRQMGVAEAPIAQRLEDYAPLALALGRDPERRRVLRQALLEAAGRELFEDMQAVREFETFLEAAVEAAGRGEKLPPGWKPDIQVSQTR